eukprot:CAMPEP_0174242372 /NCGR_PEP_ID=MMETSP0417-20130205/27652_1 /TAXON_ID=242541 /ORGANISM="Mayorella sp, Strain BSH-02190019" /LENGTH=98 /DNA_ID=CAMNT_0015321753 /DNA_START=25 /DNA_END=319 /DNA_ORIENTATION=+
MACNRSEGGVPSSSQSSLSSSGCIEQEEDRDDEEDAEEAEVMTDHSEEVLGQQQMDVQPMDQPKRDQQLVTTTLGQRMQWLASGSNPPSRRDSQGRRD